MNILPQSHSQFTTKSYWDHFFSTLKNTSNEFFEWYGTYPEYRALLSPLFSASSSIFHVGCGKSTFVEELYLEQQKNNGIKLDVVNCDYSEKVIEEMRKRNEGLGLKGMHYEVVDLLEMIEEGYQGKFDVVIDKGTLDAMLAEDTQENVEKIKTKYFPNLERALDKSREAKIVIISLLQPFVLRTLVEYFAFRADYKLQIHESFIKDSKLQPFFITITHPVHPYPEPSQISYYSLSLQSEPRIYTNLEQTLAEISTIQKQALYSSSEHVSKLVPGRHAQFDIYDKKNRQKLRYTLEITDSEEKSLLSLNTCSVFIIPQGKESTYPFNNDQGLQSLHSQIGTSRVIFVKLLTGNTFTSLTEVKDELNTLVPDFIQEQCKVDKVAYITDADQLGHRSYLFENEEVIIDEVIVDKNPVRRFFLRKDTKTPQCEFSLTYVSEQKGSNNRNKPVYKNTQILPNKKGMLIGVDHRELVDEKAKEIFCGINVLYKESLVRKGGRVLILGCQFALGRWLRNFEVLVEVVTGVEKKDKVEGKGEVEGIDEIAREYLLLGEDIKIYDCTFDEYFQKNCEDTYDIIIQCEQSPKNTKHTNLSKYINLNGLYIYQNPTTSSTNSNKEIILEQLSEQNYFPIYSIPNLKPTLTTTTAPYTIYALKEEKEYEEKTNKLIVDELWVRLGQGGARRNKIEYEWEEAEDEEEGEGFAMIWPRIGEYVVREGEKEGKEKVEKKKKKKKK